MKDRDLLKDHWQEKLKLKEYSLSKYQQMVSETPILDGESKQEAQRRELVLHEYALVYDDFT